MATKTIQSNLAQLSALERALQQQEAEREALYKAKCKAHNDMVFKRLEERIGDILKGTHKSSHNTLRLKEMSRKPIPQEGNWRQETFRLKVTMGGYLAEMSKQEVATHIRELVQGQLKEVEGVKTEVRRVEFDMLKNWWRGGRLQFYGDSLDEDTFNAIIFLGIPLLTRPLAYLYDMAFPRMRIKVWFTTWTREP